MKNKFLAIVLSAAMSATCLCALSACDKQGDSGDSTEPKTTVDNFDEWYNAIMDSFRSDNFTIEAVFPKDNLGNYDVAYVVKRSGDNMELLTYYDGFTTEYYSVNEIEKEYLLDFPTYPTWAFGLYLISKPIYDANDEFISNCLRTILWGYDVDENHLDEEFGKQLSAKIYETASYNEEDEYYEILDGEGYYRVRIKFLNGKILSMKGAHLDDAYNVEYECTYNFTYGNASVTVPDEVFAEQPATAEY